MSTITVGENKGKDKEAIMEKAQISVIRGVGVFVAFFLFLLSVGETQGAPPKPFVIECPGGSIQAELDGVQPGETLTVSGFCNEGVRIGEQVHDITLDGQGTPAFDGPGTGTPGATIKHPSGRNTIIVRGRGIVIKGFTITGGSNGILVQRGGAAAIIDNTIEDNVRGIQVSEGASARIGFSSVNDPEFSPNLIRNNDREGIRVLRHASARIVANTISGNRDGIVVREVSWAEITDNVINDNRRRGIDVTRNSGVDLESNHTTFIGRQDVGIRCTNNSYIRGELGTLTGSPDGSGDISDSCNVTGVVFP